MSIANRREALILLLGDMVAFAASLWLTLFLRYLEIPKVNTLLEHFVPFSIIFLFWIILFFIAGLYEKHTMLLKNRLPEILLNAQILNSAVAVLFFYLFPYFGINPKTNLFIYLIISFILVLFWRIQGSSLINFHKKEGAILVGEGKDMVELVKEINQNDRYSIKFFSFVDLDKITNLNLQKDILDKKTKDKISYVVADLESKKISPILPELYKLSFSGVELMDINQIYEEIFDRLPDLALNRGRFGLHEIHFGYETLKRITDIVLALIFGLLSLVIYPLIALAIKLEDGGPILISQERVGRNNALITVHKFRTMKRNDRSSDKWGEESGNMVTKVGNFLRRASIDELPQIWNILKGELSFVGPRSDISGLGARLAREIPFYNMRYLVTPGISGWAQVNQHYSPGNISPQSVEETRVRLTYDLYYLKHRSFLLDLQITLRTIKTLLLRLIK